MKQHLIKAKTHFVEKAKVAGMTAVEVGILTGSMIATNQFLDFKDLFKKKIAADPTYADQWFIKHQGALKLGAGCIGAAYIKNPYLKLIAIGVAVVGAIEETRVIAGKREDGSDYIATVGQSNLDQQLEDLARGYDRELHEGGTSGIVDEYGSGTAGRETIVNQYGSATAGVGYRSEGVYREFQ